MVSNTRPIKSNSNNITIDRRFAIIIGINDYAYKPLTYCVKDALAVSNILESKCCFEKDDIFSITSDSTNPIKDISGHLDIALKQIAKVLKPQTDSVFFYFAGHGAYHFEQSCIHFHDSLVEISDIYKRINDLQPKYQCYVIDACESGSKVITRGSSNSDLIGKYISKSSGILFMYAATDSENAKELERIKHGLFTYYFLEAIKNEAHYDEDGILTPNRIQDIIARETSKESKFKQTPVIENRTIGYYPFAIKTKVITDATQKNESNRNGSKNSSDINKLYFPQIPNEIRIEISTELKIIFDIILKKVANDFKLEGYEITTGNNLSIFNNLNIEDKLTDSIVDKSRKENVESVHLLFSTEREENTPTTFSGTLSIIDALIHRKQPKYTYYNRIQWHDDRLIAFSINLKSNDITKVSCGIVIIVYQAVFGIGMAVTSFYLDFTGYQDTQLNGPITNIEAFKVHNMTIANIKERINSHLNNFKGMIDQWNAERQNQISAFENKAQ